HAVIKKRGIDKKDFQTAQFTVSPRYTYDKSRQSPPAVTGYQVVNEVRVRNRNLSSLGEFLDEAVALGANQIRGISFDISDPSQLLDEARRKAFADAEHRACIYAGAAGLKLGTPITIEEQTGHAIPHTAMRMEAATAAAVPIAQGEQTLTVVVTVTFAVVDAR
ncbi:MAG: SIMPL domain-containing protein, partial [Syntrophaceae bacterium]|nr:SIMPL domain-containing protein [Syntrophaceae bacterium]